jgi:hypothetical protein
MVSALVGLAVAITLAQPAPEGQPAGPASSSSRVWDTLKFGPSDSGSQRSEKGFRFSWVQKVELDGQVKQTPCTRMPRVQVDASVDPKIIVPLPTNASEARIRIVGGEQMPTCATR